MSPDRNKKSIINYPPETLKSFRVLIYSWIDNLNFTLNPADCLENYEKYIVVAKEIFLAHDWDGDGEIELMWIPPFMFDPATQDSPTQGVVVWHVKQLENGLSFILHPAGILNNVVDCPY